MSKAAVTSMIDLDLTATRLRYDHAVLQSACSGLLHRGLFNKLCAWRHDMSRPSPPPPRGRPSASHAADQTQRSSSFPRPIRSHGHRCTCLALRPRWVKQPGNLDLLTLKVVSESRVTWATSVPILVFLSLSVLDLGPMYATDVRQTSDKSIA